MEVILLLRAEADLYDRSVKARSRKALGNSWRPIQLENPFSSPLRRHAGIGSSPWADCLSFGTGGKPISRALASFSPFRC